MGDKSSKPSESYTDSTQAVWDPQAQQLESLYGKAADWQTANQGAIDNLSGQAQNYGAAARDAVAPVWMNQLQGGNLGGYDIAGELAGRLGQNNNISAQQIGPNAMDGSGNTVGHNNIKGRNVNANLINKYGANNPTLEYQLAQGYSGGNSSLDNMMGTMSSAAREAQSNMMGGLDARAAASGMSGGSRHGVATAAGMRDINQNLQDNISNIGYDAYNKDYDRAMQMGQNADQYNQQRSLANQQNSLQSQMANQSDAFNVNQSNQQAALKAAMANQGQQFQYDQGNQDAALRAAQANQGASLEAGQANQDYGLQQQQQLGDLVNQQNMNASGAIGQQDQVANYINGPMQGLMSSTAGMDFLQRMLGGPNNLTQSESETTGSIGDRGGSVNVGNVGVKY